MAVSPAKVWAYLCPVWAPLSAGVGLAYLGPDEGRPRAIAVWTVAVAWETLLAYLMPLAPQRTFLLGLALLATPFFLGAEFWALASFAFYILWVAAVPRLYAGSLKGSSIPRMRPEHRMAFVTAAYQITPCPAGLDWMAVVCMAFTGALSALYGKLAMLTTLDLYLRCGAAGMHLVFALWTVYHMESWRFKLGGMQIGNPFFDSPWLSLSLRDFWSGRWNGLTHSALKLCVYSPLKKLGLPHAPVVMVVFLVTASIHIVPVLLAGFGFWEIAVPMIVYFELHAVLLLSEGFVHPEQWGVVGTAWVAIALLLPSPLLLAPIFRAAGAPLDCGSLDFLFRC
mmetsp:Transcript_5689/g.13554  ORF Transcript_5689/g.13554 Transcript_5689/m.13554 type:complete len:339 (+) Transcript_5689:20-1036(+)